MEDATTRCLHRQQQQQQQRKGDQENMLELLGQSIMYLESLQQTLQDIPVGEWNQEPREKPPALPAFSSSSFEGSTPSRTPTLAPAVYYNDTESEDEGDEAGDRPVLFQRSPTAEPSDSMTVLRLLIRLGTYIADIYARKGSFLAQQHHAWTEGAQAMVTSIVHMRTSLQRADDQISKFFQLQEEAVVVVSQRSSGHPHNSKNNQMRQKELVQDADIVHVAVQSLFAQRDKYHQAAKRQISKLKRILYPQWRSRDEVKRRMGNERWENNPNRKNDFAQLREESEQELKELQAAMESLDDMETLQESMEELQSRLLGDGGGGKAKRYNGTRPPQNVNRIAGFPDPTEYGWRFTGSDTRVEFFEKSLVRDEDFSGDGTTTYCLVKLDFYFTTGTIKTSMDHPTQGKTQLFASAKDQPISVELFREILLNPRVHTNLRYQTKKHRNNNRTRNDQRN